MKLQITPIDRNAAENGVWTNYRGVDLLIARGNNVKFKAAFRRVTEPYPNLTDLPEEKSAELLADALAEGVLLNWKNFQMEGKEIEYSKLNAKNLLVNDIDCREFVTDFSNEIDNFFIKQVEKVAGEA